MYTIKSVSADGTYYLVNGWYTYKKWWTRTYDGMANGFKTPGLAMRSLNKLINYEPDFLKDTFTLMKWGEHGELIPMSEVRFASTR